MATPTNPSMYKGGSLAALRAERAKKKEEQENKKNVLMPTTPSTPYNASSHQEDSINAKTPSTDNSMTSMTNDSHLQQPNNNDNNGKTKKNGLHRSRNSNSAYIDEFGFCLTEEEKQAKLKEIGSDTHRNNIRKQNERIYKWLHMLENWDTYTTTKKAKLKSRIRKGIPAPLRAKVWKKIMGVEELTKDERLYYSKLRYQPPVNKFKSSIDNDLDRTFPRHILFTKQSEDDSVNNKGGRGKDSLKNVLYAYANHDTDVGYTQGMGFITALFLMLMTEDDAFYCLCKLLDGSGSFQMRGLYLDGLPLLHQRYYQFDELLKKFMPKVHEHVVGKFKISPGFYASKWFITIFCYEFPFDFVYRIWDIYLHEGIKSVFRISLALIKMHEHQVLKINQFDEMMKYLQHIHADIKDVNILLTAAFHLPLKHEHLDRLEEAYNRKKLQEQREQARGGGRRGRGGRDASELEQPDFIKRFSHSQQTGTLNVGQITPLPITPVSTATTPEHLNSDDDDVEELKNLYKDKNNKSSNSYANSKPVISEENEMDEEKKENDDDGNGSHSDSSYVDDEPSSLLPNGKDDGHEPIQPHTDSNGHSYNVEENND